MEKLLEEIRDSLKEMLVMMREDRQFREITMAEAQKRAAESTKMLANLFPGGGQGIRAMFDPLRRKP